MNGQRNRVVIVGAGFAGLAAARALAGRPWRRQLQVTVVDQHNHHTFTPFLYQVATARLEPSSAAHPVRALLRGQAGIQFRLATVSAVNVSTRQVQTDRGPIPYDYLILAAGAVNDYDRNAGLATRCLALNDLGEALALRNHLLTCFEASAWATDPAERARLLTFAVVGGGPTGVEFAAALARLSQQLIGGDFSGVGRDEATIVLTEASPVLLATLGPDLQDAALRRLRAQGVEVIPGARAVSADSGGLSLEDGRHINAATVVWAAGVRASPLAGILPATGSNGRAIVNRALQLDRHPDIFVVGDMAEIPGQAGPLPMLAQVAIQSGRHAARSIRRIRAGHPARPFRYRALGTTAAAEHDAAAGQPSRLHLNGTAGGLAWLGVHMTRTAGLRATSTLALDWVGYLPAARAGQVITRPGHQPRGTAWPAGPESATARVPMPAARVDLPSVNVANANRWGRAAALAWWSQAYPGLRSKPTPPRGRQARRSRMRRLRHELTGDKSQTHDTY